MLLLSVFFYVIVYVWFLLEFICVCFIDLLCYIHTTHFVTMYHQLSCINCGINVFRMERHLLESDDVHSLLRQWTSLSEIVSLWCVCIWSVESAVLDPSLYLVPSPPLTDTRDSISAADMWSRPLDSRVARDAGNALPQVIGDRPATKRKPQPMEKAKLFWPSIRSSHYNVGAGNVQVPLTFSLSGLYGKYSPGTMGSSGVIGSTYGTVSEIGGTVVSSLAGTGYGKYRTYSGLRIYGGENGPAWSGWGNGKWGHYGKG